jgi:cell division septation protein DedD
MSDEGVHEIQLNGKQLVFMFMAVTVVAVVIFLCGVMVGRGVRAPHVTEAANTTSEPPADPTVLVQSSPLTPESGAASSSPSGASLPTATPVEENLSHSGSLSAAAPPQETLREPIVKNLSAPERAPLDLPAPRKAEPRLEPAKSANRVEPLKADATKTAQKAAEQARAEARAAASKAAAVSPAAAPSGAAAAGNGFVVQVAAVKARSEADSIAKRLSSKGFPSYVTTPGPGAARVFRVRVGKFTDRREAESVARRLEKEEQFKPWITR